MEPGKLYHLYTHANGFENLFRTDENYRYFLEKYELFIPKIADTLCYCLMPNHIHFLVRVKMEEELTGLYKSKYPEKEQLDLKTLQGFKTLEEFVTRQFGHLFNAYTQSFNKVYNRKGSLFIHTFKRKPIISDYHFTKIIHYIHANPVHHGFVKTLTDWPWSSYHNILNNKPTFLKADEVISWFATKEEFIKFHQQPIDIKTRQEFDF